MRSHDIKVHRTDGSTDTPNDARLLGVRAAIQSVDKGDLASKIVLLHDHKGKLTVYHIGELDKVEGRFLRALWEINCEPAEHVEFAEIEVE